MPIRNEKDYYETLARLLRGAQYIESDAFHQKSFQEQQKILRHYDDLSQQIFYYRSCIDEWEE